MANIEDLRLGAAVRYHFTNGTVAEGIIAGRRMGGHTEGDVDPDGYPHAPGQEPDRVKVSFPTTGVPPETISVSCAPNAVELLDQSS